MRSQKTDNGDTTYYYYDSNKNLIALTKGNYTLLFYYDSDGNVTSFKYNGTMYYYIKNLQGDIVKIISQSGTVYASYVYDAWGNIHSETGDTTLRSPNPFRYRGYVYDTDTGFYYLQSRYYDPTTGRFINADDTAYIGATGTVLSGNLFTYCENDCVNGCDPNGCYNRDKVLLYVCNYWLKPNFPLYPYYPTGDCANFVSQCLHAGGKEFTKEWCCILINNLQWFKTKTWINVKAQFKYFFEKKNGFINGKYIKLTSPKDIKKAIEKQKIKVGDLLYFSKGKEENVYHAVIISYIKKDKKNDEYEIYYAGHTSHCYKRPLSKYMGKDSVYIIKINN